MRLDAISMAKIPPVKSMWSSRCRWEAGGDEKIVAVPVPRLTRCYEKGHPALAALACPQFHYWFRRCGWVRFSFQEEVVDAGRFPQRS